MALYDNPPSVDPATGRLPSYKQVLQQDPATGVYKIKYEYTQVSQRFAGLQSPAEILNKQLTTPVTTFPGIGTGTGDDSDDDTDDDSDSGNDTGGGTGGGVQTNLSQGDGRDGGYYDFQGGGNAFGEDNRSDLQKQLDTAFPTGLERLGVGLVGGLVARGIPGIGTLASKLGQSYMTTQRENALADINQAIEDGTFTVGYKTSEIAKALEDNKNLPDNVVDYMTRVISMKNIPVKRSTVLDDSFASLGGVVQDPMTGDAQIAEQIAAENRPGASYGWNSVSGSTMTSNSVTTNDDGTTTTNLSGIQTADSILNEGTSGTNNYSDTQVNNAQNTINGAVQEGGPAYGLDEGLSAIGYGYDADTGNYSGTVGWSGGTVTTGYNANIQNENYQNFFNQNTPDPDPSPVSTGGDGTDDTSPSTPDPSTPEPSTPDLGGPDPSKPSKGSCFVAGTHVTMADGTAKNIEDIAIGEKLKGETGDNIVVEFDRPTLGERLLFAINDGEPFVTSEHPFKTSDGWKAIDPTETAKETDMYVEKLNVGDVLITDADQIKVDKIKAHNGNSEDTVYNFILEGDRTYYADGYLVHNKGPSGPGGCFVEGTPIQMADGTTKEITTIKVGEEIRGGIVQAKMEFMPQNIYDYKGVLVSGSHWVVEDNQLIAVEDSKHGVLTDRVEPVYTFKTSDNRIWINDIEFGDFETGTDEDWEPHFEMVRQDLNKKLRGEI